MNSPSAKPLDRRVQRTRRLLSEALIALISERGFDDLSIQDITDRADLRRATFYLHYRDKDELLQATLSELFAELIQESGPDLSSDALGGKTRVEPFLITFRHVAAHASLYQKILTGHAGAQVARFIRDHLAAHITAGLQTLPPEQLRAPVEVISSFIAGAEFNLLLWWVENGQVYSAEQMAAIAHRLILEGVRSAVDGLP